MLELTDQELLVLFEFCHRICETEKVAASDPAELVVIDKVAGVLERRLPEPFDASYPEILGNARKALLDDYKSRMGPHAWVDRVSLDQT